MRFEITMLIELSKSEEGVDCRVRALLVQLQQMYSCRFKGGDEEAVRAKGGKR